MSNIDLDPYTLTNRAGKHDDSNGTPQFLIPPRNRRLTVSFLIRDAIVVERAVESIANGLLEENPWALIFLVD
ncbi:hypothetical protein L2E82_36086 [Cichorium intybus]|uniref:Uncharacterized protein n=1 Tax=Cichorium intybus TaxID=13427 RepID=A0ACB9BQY4_CICIN|nr:hypothetical protein L2E82_36086 [Cichorium intybus]